VVFKSPLIKIFNKQTKSKILNLNFVFFHFRNPTPKNILGVHWTPTKQGEILEYLALNTTENSTTLWNYRQRECAFWTEYLPTVIGYITPTYPPTTEVTIQPLITFESVFGTDSAGFVTQLVWF
jgi:hypothetical protein